MGEVADLLEGAGEVWCGVREPWLARALLLYHADTGHARALDLLARAPEPHARHLAEALHDDLLPRALPALPALLARRPAALLPRLAAPPLLRDLARLSRNPAHRTHALLALAVLVAYAPPAASHVLPDLAAAILAALPPPDPHVALAVRALFHALYGTQPCAVADALRDALPPPGAARDAAERALAPLLQGARLHPHLLLRRETRRRLEPHDVPAECRRYELDALPDALPPRTPPPPPPTVTAPPALASSALLRPGFEPWFSLAERAGADSAPHTPLPTEGGSPPEAAVEATPENTPAKEQRAAPQFTFPNESTAVRSLGRLSQPPSPLRKDSSGGGAVSAASAMEARLARVVLERARAEPEPEPPPPPEEEDVPEAWRGVVAPRRPPARDGPHRRAGPGLRRASSCPPAPRRARHHVATQTVDNTPPEYEFVLADFYKTIADPPASQGPEREEGLLTLTESELYERLDEYLSRRYAVSGASGEAGALAEQLAMTHAHLMHERWRREAHAERNRRLLGRCRASRQAELANRDLRDKLRALTAERDALLARAVPLAPRRSPALAAPAAASAAPSALRDALQAERAARDRAEARLRDAEAQRAEDALEARKARAQAADATRRADSLARAASLAERRGELVRSLRRELLLLGERDVRLTEAAQAGGAAAASASAAEAACAAAVASAAAARSEAEASRARAEALAARLAEAEAALGAREAALGAARRSARAAGAEAAARLDALQDKYRALMHVLRRMEARRLELAAGGAAAATSTVAGAESPLSSPLSASLASHVSEPADCRRVRDLLLDDEDA